MTRVGKYGCAAALTLAILVCAAAAVAASPLKGSYGRTVSGGNKSYDGKWVLVFKGNGRYTVAVQGHIIGKGILTAKGTKVTVHDSACKLTQTGVYTYTLKGTTLTFKRISDPCPGRSTVLAKPLQRVM
jgi:hypothetical protein